MATQRLARAVGARLRRGRILARLALLPLGWQRDGGQRGQGAGKRGKGVRVNAERMKKVLGAVAELKLAGEKVNANDEIRREGTVQNPSMEISLVGNAGLVDNDAENVVGFA
jgi:50S ribosomal subunit-associated GTPase HflX